MSLTIELKKTGQPIMVQKLDDVHQTNSEHFIKLKLLRVFSSR